jgi:TfoX/Sxy family transcriptional regulator of competence genes
MPYNEVLAARIRKALEAEPGIVEKKMFGGIGFMLHGNLACGVHKQALMVRVGPDQHAAALARRGASPFDMTGKPMAGWVLVDEQGCSSDKDLNDWIKLGLAFAASLPAKA